MGENSEISSLIGGIGMSDAEILAVIAPSVADRDRSALIEKKSLPGHAG
jgi:hypothetical protein